ncbi:hypothetical protein PAXRUDRAFT_404905 [Paxillus rubicundulus Ve08.2h10]|uniref:Uncharacterized protein n=1 Tax=Paxillus rubicundulus Ve08.2h10 TaxID=930991 RepID=A0A0D0E5K3_9AGAM|nr:hypothetical protein PAXRUDRAFT_404905 [Paxillus rubicundulus Ve08.2h10]
MIFIPTFPVFTTRTTVHKSTPHLNPYFCPPDTIYLLLIILYPYHAHPILQYIDACVSTYHGKSREARPWSPRGDNHISYMLTYITLQILDTCYTTKLPSSTSQSSKARSVSKWMITPAGQARILNT